MIKLSTKAQFRTAVNINCELNNIFEQFTIICIASETNCDLSKLTIVSFKDLYLV